ncbi:hypothetical protein F2Q70_00025173 [Brassica cretica]|uniref:Uncharacterized protein n=1 Tax=Brassica cretica TaxID=69181 RepID=A0A8S9L3S6_BRACR|nr:hypothetical protein F2Q70_00025173 [Brassica cretica]
MSTTRKRARPEPQSLKKQAPERKTPGRFRRSRCFQVPSLISLWMVQRSERNHVGVAANQRERRKHLQVSLFAYLYHLSVSTEAKSKIDELKSKLDKERQNFAKAHLQRCESLLKDEAAKFEQIHHKFMKEKADHLEGLKVTVSKFEENKERLYMRYEQLSKANPLINETNVVSWQQLPDFYP